MKNRLIVCLLFLFAVFSFCGETNLLQRGCILSGSDFGAISRGWKLETFAYYPQAVDGDEGTRWRGFLADGPHWLDARWRAPMKMNRLRWSGRKIESGELKRWENGEYFSVVSFNGVSGEVSFPEISAERVRLELKCTEGGVPEMYEWALYGPEQPILPDELPEKFVPNAQVMISGLSPAEIKAKPGDKISFSFEAAATGDVAGCCLLAELKEEHSDKRLRSYHGDFEITDVVVPLDGIGGKPRRFIVEMTLPPWTPSGRRQIKAQVLTKDGGSLIGVDNPNLVVCDVIRSEKPYEQGKNPPAASISDLNGWRGFKVGEKVEPPFMNHWSTAMDFERFFMTRGSTVHLHNVQLYPNVLGPRETWGSSFARLEQAVSAILDMQPDAYILVGFDLRPSAAWKEQHPNAMMMRPDGSLHLEKNRKIISYGSEELLKDSIDYVDALIDYIEGRPWASRVIAYMPWSNTKNDSSIGGLEDNRSVGDRSKLKLGDFHPGAIAAFRAFLRKKYANDVSALRRAWGDKNVSFETAMVDAAALGAEDIPAGVFRDVVKNRAVVDYWEFFPSLLGNYLRTLATHIKKRTDGKALVFGHYGCVLNTITSPQPTGNRIHSGNYDLPQMLKDGNFDMYVQAMPYNRRAAGMHTVVYQPVASIALHNRMYMMDYDMRTIAAGTLLFGRHRSIAETDAIVKRDLSWLYTNRSGAWFADMSQEHFRKFTEARTSWLGAPEVTAPYARMLDVFRKASAERPRKSATEIAFIFSMQSPAREDILNSAVTYYNLVDLMFNEEAPCIGAPYDIYMADDLCEPQFPEYKLYCFVNLFYATPEQRAAIERLKKNGHTLLFFYAPGYVSDNGFSVAEASKMCGISLAKDDAPAVPHLTLSGTHPLLANLSAKELHGGGWNSCAPLHPEIVSPNFYVNDKKAVVLGRDKAGRAALVVKEQPDYKVIYSAVPFFNKELLRNAARYAGVHIYNETGAVIAADNALLMVHNGCDHAETIPVVPRPGTRLRDVFTGELLPDGVKLEIRLKAPETKIFYVEK